MKTVLIILAVITIAVLCFLLWADKIGNEKRFCHYCEELFLSKKYKNKTCPFCGNPLTTFYEHENKEQNEMPFEEFEDKTDGE